VDGGKRNVHSAQDVRGFQRAGGAGGAEMDLKTAVPFFTGRILWFLTMYMRIQEQKKLRI
jgi:hypothetical protein